MRTLEEYQDTVHAAVLSEKRAFDILVSDELGVEVVVLDEGTTPAEGVVAYRRFQDTPEGYKGTWQLGILAAAFKDAQALADEQTE